MSLIRYWVVAVMLSFSTMYGFGLYGSCVEPNEPYCLMSKFDNAREFDNCKMDIEKYLRDLNDWVKCTQNEAVTKSNDAIRKFNCLASGDRFCY